MPYKWQMTAFSQLGEESLYKILHLRQAVFVVEQACLYQDLDGFDQMASHLLCWSDGELAAYQRSLPPGTRYPESSIGRIVVAPRHRATGLGKTLVTRGIAYNLSQWPKAGIRINAQAYLQEFYSELGFCPVGDIYDEDGIPHVQMLYQGAKGD